MNDYVIVNAAGTTALMLKVKEMIGQGWMPIGGVCVCPTKVEANILMMYCYQAMTK